jgi:flagellar biosynthesis protein FlhB
MSDTSEEKTEAPSEKKLREAMERGDRPQSAIVNHAISYLFIPPMLALSIVPMFPLFKFLLDGVLDSPFRFDMRLADVAIIGIVVPLAILFLCVLIAGVVSSIASIGLSHGQFAPAFEAISPKFEKLNPTAGMKRLFSVKNLYETIRHLIYFCALSAVFIIAIYSMRNDFRLAHLSTSAGVTSFVLGLLQKICLLLICCTLVFALFDKAIQDVLWKKNLKMSKSEVKREHISQEGDPLIKNERKANAKEAAETNLKLLIEKVNFLVIDPAKNRALGYAIYPSLFEHPVSLVKASGDLYSVVNAFVRTRNVKVVIAPSVVDQLYAKSREGQFTFGTTSTILLELFSDA